MSTDVIERTAAPEAVFFDAEPWAIAQHLGVNFVYECCRREADPMPHLRRGRRYLIDHVPAVAWLRREFGVGYPEED